MQKRTQSLVVITVTVIMVTVVAIRTKTSWASFARQSLRETLGNELIVLSHLLSQKAQTLEDAYLGALNKKPNPNVKIIYSRVLQKSESGKWSLVETQEIPGSGAFFAKQIPENYKPTGKNWLRLTDAKGEPYAGLILPVTLDGNGQWKVSAASEAKNLVFAVFKDPFSDVLEIFKGTNATFTIIDSRSYVMAHSTEEYQGVQAGKEMQRLIDSYRLESFVERKAGKKAGGYIGIQKIPELNLTIGAEIAGGLVGIKYYRWLFEMLAGAVLFLVAGLFFMNQREETRGRRTATQPAPGAQPVQAPQVVSPSPAVSNPIPMPALPQKDFVSEPVTKPLGTLEKLMNLAAGIKNKRPKSEPQPIVTQVTGFQSTAPAMVDIPSLETASIKPMLISLLAEAASDIRIFGVQVDDKLDEVPEVQANPAHLQTAIEGLMKLTFFSVRQKMAKKVKIRLQRLGKNIELILGDNGLPRKTNDEQVILDLVNQPNLATLVQEAFQTVRKYKGEVLLRYDFHNGNQIILRLPMSSVEAPTRPVATKTSPSNEEIKKRYSQFQVKNVNVRKPKIREIEE